jgi:hypothetical protein
MTSLGQNVMSTMTSGIDIDDKPQLSWPSFLLRAGRLSGAANAMSFEKESSPGHDARCR